MYKKYTICSSFDAKILFCLVIGEMFEAEWHMGKFNLGNTFISNSLSDWSYDKFSVFHILMYKIEITILS